MKKSIIKITAVTVFSFISFTALAQTTADKKPKIDEASKTTEQGKTPVAAMDPQIVSKPKVLTVKDQPKPIVPGGEFKPMDTNNPRTTDIKTKPADKDQPVMPAIKKAGPPPVVTEMNADPSAQDRAKPAPVQVIVQKQ